MTTVKICIDVSDLDEAGVEGQESGDWDSLTRCADPFGNGFCLVTT